MQSSVHKLCFCAVQTPQQLLAMILKNIWLNYIAPHRWVLLECTIFKFFKVFTPFGFNLNVQELMLCFVWRWNAFEVVPDQAMECLKAFIVSTRKRKNKQTGNSSWSKVYIKTASCSHFHRVAGTAQVRCFSFSALHLNTMLLFTLKLGLKAWFNLLRPGIHMHGHLILDYITTKCDYMCGRLA